MKTRKWVLSVSTVNELVVHSEVPLVISVSVGVQRTEDGVVVQIEPSVATLVNDPRDNLSFRPCVRDLRTTELELIRSLTSFGIA